MKLHKNREEVFKFNENASLFYLKQSTLNVISNTNSPLLLLFSKIESCIITLLEAADQPYVVFHLLNGNMLLKIVETELTQSLQGPQLH